MKAPLPSARQMQRAVILEHYERSLCVPNYTPSDWFECDVFRVTKAGYFVEYEVKASRADFFKDSEKTKGSFVPVKNPATNLWRMGEVQTETKHQRLRRGDPVGPKHFWFVVPKHLVYVIEVPKFAGLIYCEIVGKTRVQMTVAKEAPQLHAMQLGRGVDTHARGVCYWRFLKLFIERHR